MFHVETWVQGAAAASAAGLGFWAMARFLPGILVKKLHVAFEAAKSNPWWRNPEHPHRAKWLLATAQLLEEEIPEPGQGQEVYDTFGRWASATLKVGSAAQWAKAARQGGDALDTALDAEIQALAAEPPPAAPGA